LDDPVIIVVWLENEGEETERLNAKSFQSNSEIVIAANKSHFNLSRSGEKRKFFKGVRKIEAERGAVLSLISSSKLKMKIGEIEFGKWRVFISNKLTVYPRGVVGYQVSCHETPGVPPVKRFVDIKGHLFQLNKSEAGKKRQYLAGLASEWQMESILLAIIDDLKAWMKKLEEKQKEKLKRIERHELEIKNVRQRQEWSKWRIAALKAALTAADH
jgi:hypothetical protein